MAKTFSPRKYLSYDKEYENECQHEIIYFDFDQDTKQHSNYAHCLLCEQKLDNLTYNNELAKEKVVFCKNENKNKEDLLLTLTEAIANKYYLEEKIDLVNIIKSIESKIDSNYNEEQVEEIVFSPTRKRR